MLITDTLDSVRKRAMVLGRWAPAVFYVLIGGSSSELSIRASSLAISFWI